MDKETPIARPDLLAAAPAFSRAAMNLLAQREVTAVVHPEDEMLIALLEVNQGDAEQALFRYFQIGAEVADTLKEILNWHVGSVGSLSGVGNLLDLASGFGRVTRFLLKDFGRENVWVSDILPRAMEFQKEQFAAQVIQSSTDPLAFRPERVFDVITVCSLFTHLPSSRFEMWLRRLGELLAPSGLLIFSVHDEAILSPSTLLPKEGFLFLDYSESKTLATSEYGCTWVNEHFVRTAIQRAAPDARVHRIPRGLCNYQDIYILTKNEHVDFGTLQVAGSPEVFVERCVVSNGSIDLGGWALLRGSGSVSEIVVSLENGPTATTKVTLERPDVVQVLGDSRWLNCGWTCALKLPTALSYSSLLQIEATTDKGVRHLVHNSSIDAALRQSSDRLVAWASASAEERARQEIDRIALERDHLGRQMERYKTQRDELLLELSKLEGQIAWMKESRFWRLRETWWHARNRWLRK